MMSRQPRFIQMSLGSRIFLGVLAVLYLGYLVTFANFLHPSNSSPSIIEHLTNTNFAMAIQHWTPTSMRNAVDPGQQDNNASDFTQGTTSADNNKVAQQQLRPPISGEASDPLSIVGKVFFTNASGQDMVCSGTALVSSNQSVVDTAGHCLYWNNNWVQNVIFCPLYDSGSVPYDCWAARDLEVPSDWIDRQPNDLHHDFGMAIVAPNSRGKLTDIVGGAGWTYSQPADQAFYAYGYPAAPPFDGQTRQSCENRSGILWKHAGGTVISIPCDMTGGSSGGPWFIQINGNLYLDGHNDFTSTIQPGHMFSPYYDNTWYALYQKAQYT